MRKTVTVVFCDVTGSTALGERLDPEALRRTMGRYFEAIRTIVERHGGLVEKFIGDAVMAVFGIPAAHEDDALRAVRAVAEIQQRLAALGEELAVSLSFRTGVNTGEVVAGEGETLVTGDAVNVAARLEQAATPGEILIGAETLRLVRDAVIAEPVEPLELKGKREPVLAYRLEAVDPAAPGHLRRLDAPLVGRVREQRRLAAGFEDAVSERACHLFTLLGPAGVGKSRIVEQFLTDVADGADILRSRCLHYGDDITYWPLVELLVAMGAEPDAVIGGSPAETQLTFRRLLEERAFSRPQILLLDDLHWAESLFLDLVEHVADWSREAPILLLCVARPELLETRPGWGGGKLNATTILLEPLSSEDSGLLVERLASGSELPIEVRERIVAAAEGNPLFIEEMLAMASENGGGNRPFVIPPSIQALLQARLDRLASHEREVISCGAVEGQVFHGTAVLELAEGTSKPEIPTSLLSLVRKELIRPDRSAFTNDEAFRFRHLLIRDAAYDSLPKGLRADLHERFAHWLEDQGDLVELDEIVGYHIEQAHRNRAELDAADPRLGEIAPLAATRFQRAARVALGRGDLQAAIGLLQRSAALLPAGEPQRLEGLIDLVDPLCQAGRIEDARAAVAELSGSDDRRYRAYAALLGSLIQFYAGEHERDETQARIDGARAALLELGDELGLAYCELLQAGISWTALRAEETRAAARRGVEHAGRAGVEYVLMELSGWEITPLVGGPVPVDEALRLADAALERASGRLLLEARISSVRGRLLAMCGDAERGRELVHAGVQTARDAGLLVDAAAGSLAIVFVEIHAGDLEAAERAARAGAAELEQMADRAYLPTVALMLAKVLVLRGAYVEAAEWCEVGRTLSAPDDVVNFAYADLLEGFLLAQRGEQRDGEVLIRRGIDLCETTDFYDERGYAQELLAQALALAGRNDEAREAANRALATYEAKGDQPLAARARQLVGEIALSV